MLQLKFGNCHFIIAKKGNNLSATEEKKSDYNVLHKREIVWVSFSVQDGRWTKVLLASHILIEHSVVIRLVASWVSNEYQTASISLYKNNSIRHFLSYTLPDTAYSSWLLWNCFFPWCLQFVYAFHEIKAGENTKQRWITCEESRHASPSFFHLSVCPRRHVKSQVFEKFISDWQMINR